MAAKMIRATLLKIGISLFFAGPALANDLSSKWTGFYIGGSAGVTGSATSLTFDQMDRLRSELNGYRITITPNSEEWTPDRLVGTAAFDASTKAQPQSAFGGVFGIHMGGDFAVSNRLIFGLRGDAAILTGSADYHLRGRTSLRWTDGRGGEFLLQDDFAMTERLRPLWLASISGRIGYAATENVLIYGTLGWGIIGLRSLSVPRVPFQQSLSAFDVDRKTPRLQGGLTVGLGAEIDLGNRWSLIADYRVTLLNSASGNRSTSLTRTGTLDDPPGTTRPANFPPITFVDNQSYNSRLRQHGEFHMLRFGVSRRF